MFLTSVQDCEYLSGYHMNNLSRMKFKLSPGLSGALV